MKKLLCMLLAAILLVSTMGVMAMAEGEALNITIDGVKDSAYVDSMSLDDIWNYWSDASNATEPVNVDRVKNTLWFRWDNDFVYLYFQAVSMDPLYQPPADQVDPPNREITYFEQVNLYLDTAPSAEYLTKCTQGDKDENGDAADCNHFCCNANDGEGKYYRVMARYSAAWDLWNNYYRSDEGMFLTYEEFVAKRQGEAGYEDLQAMYMKENGAAESAGFINYETNSYGIEVKYPRLDGEEYFQLNITNDVPYKDWEVEGPELPYVQSVCKAWWTNAAELFEIYYEDWDPVGEVPAEVKALLRQREELPGLESIELEHKDKVLKLNHEYVNLKEEYKPILAEQDPGFDAYITGAVKKVNTLQYIKDLGDVNANGKIDATDALITLRAGVGKLELTAEQIGYADVNGDSKTDAKDALEMLQYAVEKRTEFSVVRTLDI